MVYVAQGSPSNKVELEFYNFIKVIDHGYNSCFSFVWRLMYKDVELIVLILRSIEQTYGLKECFTF